MSVKITFIGDNIVHFSVSKNGKKTFEKDFDDKLKELGKQDTKGIKNKF